MNAITRNQVFELEHLMLQMPQVEMKVVEYFAPGLYARELHIPAGTCVTAVIHKHKNINVVSKGEGSVLVNGTMVDIAAPLTFIGEPGTKRVGFAKTDVIWTTFFPTDLTDPEEIIAHFTCNSEVEYLAHCENLKLEGK